VAGYKMYLDTSMYRFTISLAPVAKTDQNQKQRFTKDGAPMWQTEVQAYNPEIGTAVLMVTTAGEKPKVISGEAVMPVSLEAVPWNTNGKNGVVYRATELKAVPVQGGK
jgi:hypothetical protein